jgi:hypothetical protein
MADDDGITRAEPRNHTDEQKKIEGQLAELVPDGHHFAIPRSANKSSTSRKLKVNRT